MEELEVLMHDLLTGLISVEEFKVRFLALREVILIEQDRAMYSHPTLAKEFAWIDRWSGILPGFMWRKRYERLCAQLTDLRVPPMSDLDKLIGKIYLATQNDSADGMKLEIEGFYERLQELKTNGRT